MKKSFIMAAVAVSLVTGLAVAASKASRPVNPQPHLAPVVISRPQPRETTFPAPGLYSATPCSGIVFVPKQVDAAFAVLPPANKPMDDCIVTPDVQLEPKK